MATLIFVGLLILQVSIVLSSDPRIATCYVQPDPASPQQVTGIVTFSQAGPDQNIQVNVNLSGFNQLTDPAGSASYEHGFHVHQYGDISGGCGSTGGHYNPDGVNHGAPTDGIRHPGDFGNLKQDASGKMVTTFSDRMATLYGDYSIIGRAVVVHAGVDDLGKGGDDSSLANGNAGPRLGCCVIGIASPPA